MPWLQEGSRSEITQKDIDNMEKAQDCIHCHACTSGCDTYSVDRGYLGPEALVKAYRMIKDPRDRDRSGRLRTAVQDGLWNCVRAYTCIDACPKGINPAEIISRLHEMSADYKVADPRGERHARHFVRSNRKTGKLDETMMPIKTLGLGIVNFLPDTIKMVSKGKMPPLFNKRITGKKEVWNLVELAKDRKEAKHEKRIMEERN